MKTAKDLARAAASIGSMAESLRPDDNDPYAQARNLIVFHLRIAAMHVRELAEATAAKEAQCEQSE
jgi:hypothetical protein